MSPNKLGLILVTSGCEMINALERRQTGGFLKLDQNLAK